MLLLDGAGLEAQLLRGDPHQLLRGPVSLGQGVVHLIAVPIQELVCFHRGSFRTEHENILNRGEDILSSLTFQMTESLLWSWFQT